MKSNFKKILWATDLSASLESSKAALIQFSKTFKSEVYLLHVMPPIHESPLATDMVKNIIEKYLDTIENDLQQEGIVCLRKDIQIGSPFDQIINAALFYQVDLIFLGDRSQNGENHHIGLTAEKVIKKSNLPVWVHKSENHDTISNIICPIDLSRNSKRCLLYAIAIAQKYQANLHVMTAVAPMSDLYPFMMTHHEDQAMGNIYKDEDFFIQHRKTRFNEFLEEFNFEDVPWIKHFKNGRPHQEIIKLAKNENAELIIIGSTGLSQLNRILLGSVAQKVIRELPCSIVTVR